MLRKILLVLLVLLIVIQFIRPAANDARGKDQPGAIAKGYTVPAEVSSVLKKACYDCHSNTTVYPWYSKIQPVAWWLNNHITEGKRELNFDEFMTYKPKKQDRKMDKVGEEVDEGEMPLNSYTWVHQDAKLTAQEKKLLVDWAVQVRKEIHEKTGYVPVKTDE